jgi:hypothetical protein
MLDLKPVTERGWDQGKRLTDKQEALLRKQGIDPDGLPYGQARQLLNEMFRRWDGNLCSFKQAAILRKRGLPVNVTREEASRQLDEIAKREWPGKAKIEHDDPRRYGAAVREVLRLAYLDGHMALLEIDALEQARTLAKPTLDGFDDKVKERYEADKLVLHDVYLYSYPYWKIESETAKMIFDRLRLPFQPPLNYEVISEITMSPDQEAAVRLAIESHTVVVTGGPGVGTSTVLKIICDTLAAQGKSLTLCAPTGKAARRMSDTTGRYSATLHRTLKIGQGGAKEWF